MTSTNTPNEPAWKASLLAEVAALPTAGNPLRPEAIPTTVDILPGAYGAVRLAARERKVALSSYIRRAALAMAAHDLGIPLSDLLERDPRMTRDTGVPMSDPHERRFGTWEIDALRGEEA